MAIKGLAPTKFRSYVLRDDPCRAPDGGALPGATIFQIKTLTGLERAIIRDKGVRMETYVDDNGQNKIRIEDQPGLFRPAYETLRIALCGWTNLQDPDGNDIPFETEYDSLGGRNTKVPTWACLERLETPAAFEIMAEIMGFNTLTKSEASKSGAVSSPGNSTPSATVAPATPIAASSGGVTLDLSPERKEILGPVLMAGLEGNG